MYQWDAKGYCRTCSAQTKWGLELLDKITLSGSERVLDIGCSDGELATFYDDREYTILLKSSGLKIKRVEFIPK